MHAGCVLWSLYKCQDFGLFFFRTTSCRCYCKHWNTPPIKIHPVYKEREGERERDAFSPCEFAIRPLLPNVPHHSMLKFCSPLTHVPLVNSFVRLLAHVCVRVCVLPGAKPLLPQRLLHMTSKSYFISAKEIAKLIFILSQGLLTGNSSVPFPFGLVYTCTQAGFPL